MPLIRYRTGDLGRWLPGPCPCGTELRTLAHITTRVAGGVRLDARFESPRPTSTRRSSRSTGVLDFAARVMRRPGTAQVCQIRVQVASHRALPDARDDIGVALRAGPAIGRATADGNLDSIDVIVGTDRVADPTLAKRSIAVDTCGQDDRDCNVEAGSSTPVPASVERR